MEINYFLNELENIIIPLFRKMNRLFRENTIGLSYRQLMLLKKVEKNSQITARDIARKFHLSSAAISQTISQLIEKEYIEKTRSQDDRRYYILALTKKGEDILEENNMLRKQLLKQLFSPLNKEEQQQILEIFIKLEKNVDNIHL